jgi:hypothetical protein
MFVFAHSIWIFILFWMFGIFHCLIRILTSLRSFSLRSKSSLIRSL